MSIETPYQGTSQELQQIIHDYKRRIDDLDERFDEDYQNSVEGENIRYSSAMRNIAEAAGHNLSFWLEAVVPKLPQVIEAKDLRDVVKLGDSGKDELYFLLVNFANSNSLAATSVRTAILATLT